MEETILKENGIAILKGEILAFIINTLGILILSAIMTYSDLSENMLPTLVIVINTISILIGSSIATIKLNKNGILNGLIIGGVYMVIYLLISLASTGTVSFPLKTILLISFGIIAGGVGGIIGVNMKRNN